MHLNTASERQQYGGMMDCCRICWEQAAHMHTLHTPHLQFSQQKVTMTVELK